MYKNTAIQMAIASCLMWPIVSVAQAQNAIVSQVQSNDENVLCNPQLSVPGNLAFDLLVELEPITPGFAILEGPVWLDGSLVMSHIGYSVDGVNPSDLIALRDGEVKVLQEAYLSNGLTINNQGYMVAARHFDGTITGIDNGRVFASQYNGIRFNSPNDLVFSASGNLYFSDPSYQAPTEEVLQPAERAYHVTPFGLIKAFGEGVVDRPNGVMLSQDEKTLYVGGTNGLFKFAIADSGGVIDTAEQVLAEAIPEGVDGMSRDNCGNIFIAAAGKINIMSVDEELIGSEEIPGITNVAFGGASGKDIYVTTLGERPAVYRAQGQWPHRGLPY